MKNSPEWRRECLAKYVLAMDKERREEFYKGMVEKSGKLAVNQLIDDVNKLKRKRREKQECRSA